MTKTWFYHYTGGYAGTDEYGLVIADSENDAIEQMYDTAMQHMVDWDEDDFETELECDLYVLPYNPKEHNGYLRGNEKGYIPDDE